MGGKIQIFTNFLHGGTNNPDKFLNQRSHLHSSSIIAYQDVFSHSFSFYYSSQVILGSDIYSTSKIWYFVKGPNSELVTTCLEKLIERSTDEKKF